MKTVKIGISTLLLAAFSQSASAAPFALEARSMGMGNVSVATANIATAAFSNPAMLANQRENDDFSLLIGVGGFVNDDDKVLDDIDDFQSADDRNDAAEMARIIGDLPGKVIAPELSAAFAFGFAGETYSFALSARSDIVSAGTLDPATVDTTSLAALQDPTNNIIAFEGVQATTIGFSIARDFDVMGSELSIGIKPKIVQFDAIVFEESIVTIGDKLKDLIDDDRKIDLGDVSTVDLGFALDLSDSWRLGLSIKNLITDEFRIGPSSFKLDTEYRAGIAYHSSFVTFGIDVDLKENDPFLSNPNFNGLKTQYAAIGAEFNAFDYVQLRLGASENIASGIPDGAQSTTYYAGVGFWLGFNLDIAAAVRDDSLGAYLQTGFSF